MATKYFKLHEHATGEPVVVTAKQLSDMKKAPTFPRVYREEGEASEEDVAAYRKKQTEATGDTSLRQEDSKAVTAGPTGAGLPAATGTASQGATSTAKTSTGANPGTAGNAAQGTQTGK